MAIGDRFLLKDFQTFLGQGVLNTYYYEGIGGVPNSTQLRIAFVTDVIPSLIALQSEYVTHERIEVINLDDPTDWEIHLHTTKPVGAMTGDPLPSFVTASFIYVRATRAVRNGWKRIAGVVEGVQNGGDPGPGFLTLAATLSADLGDDLSTGSPAAVYRPVIMRVTRTGTPPNVVTTYTQFPLEGVEFRAFGTQNTRKLGRGL